MLQNALLQMHMPNKNISDTRQGETVLQQCATADVCAHLRLWLYCLQRLLSLIRLQQWSLHGGSA